MMAGTQSCCVYDYSLDQLLLSALASTKTFIALFTRLFGIREYYHGNVLTADNSFQSFLAVKHRTRRGTSSQVRGRWLASNSVIAVKPL